MNKEWMDDYEENYSRFKSEWDAHYEQIRNFIHSCLPHNVKHWGFMGVTNTIPEIDSRILNRISKISLLDINDEALKRARIHLSSLFDFKNVEVQKFDNTCGFIDEVVSAFNKMETNDLSEKKLLEHLRDLDENFKLEHSSSNNNNGQFDLITHLGIMDYYMVPVYIKYCNRFQKNADEFFELMRKLNDHSVRISLELLHKLLVKNGLLIISTPVARIPEGDPCDRSIFWLDSIENIIEECGFKVVSKTEHIWNEFPTDDGHSHIVQNICCEKRK